MEERGSAKRSALRALCFRSDVIVDLANSGISLVASWITTAYYYIDSNVFYVGHCF